MADSAPKSGLREESLSGKYRERILKEQLASYDLAGVVADRTDPRICQNVYGNVFLRSVTIRMLPILAFEQRDDANIRICIPFFPGEKCPFDCVYDAVIQLRLAAYGVGTGTMTVDEAVAGFGTYSK